MLITFGTPDDDLISIERKRLPKAPVPRRRRRLEDAAAAAGDAAAAGAVFHADEDGWKLTGPTKSNTEQKWLRQFSHRSFARRKPVTEDASPAHSSQLQPITGFPGPCSLPSCYILLRFIFTTALGGCNQPLQVLKANLYTGDKATMNPCETCLL